jgi:hypothetical protein
MHFRTAFSALKQHCPPSPSFYIDIYLRVLYYELIKNIYIFMEGNEGSDIPGLEDIKPFDANAAIRGDHDEELAQRQDADLEGRGINTLIGTPEQEESSTTTGQPIEFYREQSSGPSQPASPEIAQISPQQTVEHFRLRPGEQPSDANDFQHYRLDPDEAAIERAKQEQRANSNYQHYRLGPDEQDNPRSPEAEAERIANLIAPNLPPDLRTADTPTEPQGIDVVLDPKKD